MLVLPVVPDTQQAVNLKNAEFSEVLTNSYWYAEARHPLGFAVEPRVSLDITVSKYLELVVRIALRGTQGALKCSCSWSLSEPLIFVIIFIVQVGILGIHSKLYKEDHFHFHLKCFSHYFISIY